MSDLTILNPYRRRQFDSLPKLTPDERIVYLSTDQATIQFLKKKNAHRKVGYILNKAYFQAKGRFFDLNDASKRDIKFVIKRLGIDDDFKFISSKYTKTLQNEDRNRILTLLGWQNFNANFKFELSQHALFHTQRALPAEKILFLLLDYCWEKRIVIPPYALFVSIVSEAFRSYEETTLASWNACCPQDLRQELKDFIFNPKAFVTLQEMKKINQDTALKAMLRNAELLSVVRDAFFSFEENLAQLELTPKKVKQFSESIYLNDLSAIRKQKDELKQSIIIACFIKDQFYQRQDEAIRAFKKIIRNAINTAKRLDLKTRAEREAESLDSNRTVVNSAKESRAVIREVHRISTDPTKTLSQRNEQVIQIIEAFFGAESDDMDGIIGRVDENLSFIQERFGYLGLLFDQHLGLIRKLSPILRELTFDEKASDPEIILAIDWFKKYSIAFEEDTPVSFLKKNELESLELEDEIPKISKWKILLFCHVIEGIRTKKLTLQYSYQHKTDESYLISSSEWLNNMGEYIKAAKMEAFTNAESIVNQIGKKLNKQYSTLNDLIDEEGVEGFRRASSHWSLQDLDPNFVESKFIPTLLSEEKPAMLFELLSEVDKYSNFTSALRHTRKQTQSDDSKLKFIYAAIMSLGTNLGHHNMARAARNISEKQLRDTEKIWLSAESIAKANEAIVSFIQSLPLPSIFHNNEGELHTSSDGKKVVVAVNSLLANFSYKYYGKEQGISANSFTDEQQSFFHVNVLTSSEREAPYMLDGMVEATKSLYPEGEKTHLHSTDTHGFTEAIFAALHFMNISFAPRFKQTHKQTMYSFDSPTAKAMKGRALSPKTIINRKKIFKHWDQILRIMASIKLDYCSASQVFRMLSSSERSSDVYQAIKELGRLLKSSYILTYIEQPDLRRNIQKQLNRVELGQKLSGAVFFGRKGKLMVGTQPEIQKAMAAKTLLKNAIIAWNYLYLSDYCCQLKDKDQRQEVIDSIATGSVIAWSHVNMHGVYDFDGPPSKSFRSTIAQMKALKV